MDKGVARRRGIAIFVFWWIPGPISAKNFKNTSWKFRKLAPWIPPKDHLKYHSPLFQSEYIFINRKIYSLNLKKSGEGTGSFSLFFTLPRQKEPIFLRGSKYIGEARRKWVHTLSFYCLFPFLWEMGLLIDISPDFQLVPLKSTGRYRLKRAISPRNEVSTAGFFS